jgi:hypothetical protein
LWFISALRLGRPRRLGLHLGHRGHIGLNAGLDARGRLSPTLKQPQAFFELAISVLQLLILSGELPQLIFQLLDADFRVDVLGLGQNPGEGLREGLR